MSLSIYGSPLFCSLMHVATMEHRLHPIAPIIAFYNTPAPRLSLTDSSSPIPFDPHPHHPCIASSFKTPTEESSSPSATPAPSKATPAAETTTPAANNRGGSKPRGGPASRGGGYYRRGGKPREGGDAPPAGDDAPAAEGRRCKSTPICIWCSLVRSLVLTMDRTVM